jgi:hypothetical protein
MRLGCIPPLLGAAIVIVIALAAAAGCTGTETGVPVVSPTPVITPVPVSPPHHQIPLDYSSLYYMQKNLAPVVTLSLPTNLPEGFFFDTGTQVEASGEDLLDEGYYSFLYHRGQDEWIYLQEQSRNSSACPDKPEYQTAEIGKTLTQREGTGELRWGRDRWCYILSGALTQKELEKIAASVEPVPYREDVLPPYEYQPPAHPLVRKFSVNRSSIAKGVTITVESFDCTPDTCIAKIRVDAAFLPLMPPSPVVTTMPPVGAGPRAEWRVDGGRPLMTMPGFNATSIFWKIEPLPEDSRELSVNFSSVNGISGRWQILIPLNSSQGTGLQENPRQADPS